MAWMLLIPLRLLEARVAELPSQLLLRLAESLMHRSSMSEQVVPGNNSNGVESAMIVTVHRETSKPRANT